jgi:colanic acid/amylovoran biosynthesis protein
MNIVISHVYSKDNKGDAALLGVLIQETQKEFPETKITILTIDRVDKGETFDGVPIKPSFMYFVNSHSSNKLLRLGYGLYMMTYTLSWAFINKRMHIQLPINKRWKKLIKLYSEADLIIPVGGGYLRTNKRVGSIYDLTLLIHPIILSKILAKPTVLYTQSVGPFYRKIESRMLALTLRKAVKLAIIREDKSMKLLNSMGVTNCIRSVDAGFLLIGDQKITARTKLSIPPHNVAIGVTVRKWLAPTEQRKYEKAMVTTLDYLIQKYKAYIVFIPQVTSKFHGDDDRVVSEAIYAEMTKKGHALLLTKNYNYRELKAIYGQLDFILGTRFHSVIFSLTSYVPAVAIEYEHKTGGIMHDLGLDQWVIKMEEVSPETLEPKMDDLIKEKIAYKEHLHEILPQYIKQAHEAIEFVNQAYKASLSA